MRVCVGGGGRITCAWGDTVIGEKRMSDEWEFWKCVSDIITGSKLRRNQGGYQRRIDVREKTEILGDQPTTAANTTLFRPPNTSGIDDDRMDARFSKGSDFSSQPAPRAVSSHPP